MELIRSVTPAQAGVSSNEAPARIHEIPAFAGMTRL
jgi:hypothetical protein